MSKKAAPPTYFLKIRSYPENQFVSIWIIERDGPAESWVMHGECLPARAESLAAVLGLEVEREACQLAGATPLLPVDKSKPAPERTLFDEVKP